MISIEVVPFFYEKNKAEPAIVLLNLLTFGNLKQKQKWRLHLLLI